MAFRGRGRVAVAVVGLAVSAALAQAQSAQTWSLQGSWLLANVDLGGSLVAGAGLEAQLRFTPRSVFSIGGGFQATSHESAGEKLTLTGVFFEPRLAVDIGSDRVAPYVAGRFVALSQTADLRGASDASSNGFGVGGGGGLLIRWTRTINVDLGVAFVRQSFGDATASNGALVQFEPFFGYVVKGGISVGFGSR